MSDVVETELQASRFCGRFATETTIVGVRFEAVEDGFAKARVWVEPGDPWRPNAVEALVHLWNKGLNPRIEVPAQSDVVVEVTGACPRRVLLQRLEKGP